MQIVVELTIELRDFGFCSQENLLCFFIFFSNLLSELLFPVLAITELQKNTMQCKFCYSKTSIVWVLTALYKLQIVHNVWLAELYIKN